MQDLIITYPYSTMYAQTMNHATGGQIYKSTKNMINSNIDTL